MFEKEIYTYDAYETIDTCVKKYKFLETIVRFFKHWHVECQTVEVDATKDTTVALNDFCGYVRTTVSNGIIKYTAVSLINNESNCSTPYPMSEILYEGSGWMIVQHFARYMSILGTMMNWGQNSVQKIIDTYTIDAALLNDVEAERDTLATLNKLHSLLKNVRLRPGSDYEPSIDPDIVMSWSLRYRQITDHEYNVIERYVIQYAQKSMITVTDMIYSSVGRDNRSIAKSYTDIMNAIWKLCLQQLEKELMMEDELK